MVPLPQEPFCRCCCCFLVIIPLHSLLSTGLANMQRTATRSLKVYIHNSTVGEVVVKSGRRVPKEEWFYWLLHRCCLWPHTTNRQSVAALKAQRTSTKIYGLDFCSWSVKQLQHLPKSNSNSSRDNQQTVNWKNNKTNNNSYKTRAGGPRNCSIR